MGHVTEEIRHYKDIQATALDSDPIGRYLCLAGKRFLSVVLADPGGNESAVCSKKSRSARLDVSNVRWRANSIDTPYIVLSSGQNIELYTVQADGIELVESVRAHPRNVTDVDWSTYDLNVLVTCSVDDAVSVWDIRELRRPTISLHVVAGAVQAKWAPIMHFLLATAHGTDVRVWDIRKPTSPLQSIPAHLDKINSLVWHPTDDMCFATSSQDGNLKLWDFSNASKPRLAAGLLPIPAWKVRFTRNGAGLVTLPVPQGGRGPNALGIWRSADLESVQSLQGHTDLIQDACWRPQASDSHECQLYSVAKDHTLRSWLISNDVFAVERGDDALGMSALEPFEGRERLATTTIDPPTDDWTRWVVAPSKAGLANELDALSSLRFGGITTDEINFERAAVGITFERDGNAVKLVIRFHTDYATNGKIYLHVSDESSLSAIGANQLLKQMQELCQEKSAQSGTDVIVANVLRHIPSIIDGLMLFDGQTMGSIEKSPSVLNAGTRHSSIELRPPPLLRPSLSMPPFLTSFDRFIPSPRTCGGKFNGSGILVCFGLFEYGRPGDTLTTSPVTPTPRSLGDYGSTTAGQIMLQKNANYFASRHHSSFAPSYSSPIGGYSTIRNRGISLGNGMEPSSNELRVSSCSNAEDGNADTDGLPVPSFVTLYDSCGLFPISKDLAKAYSLMSGSPLELCATNRAVASALGRSDLVVMWTLLEQCLDPKLKPMLNPDLGPPWAVHPFGRPLINSLLDFCSRTGDFQTAAMISCILGQRSRFSQRKPDGLTNARSASSSCSGDVPQGLMGGFPSYNTIHCENNLMPPAADNNFLALANRPRSSSFDEDVSPPQSPPSRQSFTIVRSSNSLCPKDKEQFTEQDNHDVNAKLLDPALSHRLESIRLLYADILSRWNLHSKAAEVLKYSSTKPSAETEPVYITNCNRCDNHVRYGMKCDQCNALAFRCCLCQMPVKGLWSVCPHCRHGGHVSHMEDWFSTYEFCPAGCGCSCLRLFC